MAKRIKHLGLYIRTALFVYALKSISGRGYEMIWKQVNQSQYQALGVEGPALDTVRDYFRLYRSPAVDPQFPDTPPWLMAAELEFPGCSYYFFHPLVDLLIGQLESSVKWLNRLSRIPEQWIQDLEERGDTEQAEEWRSFNAGLKPSRGRPPNSSYMERLEFIHLTMMRVQEPVFSILFNRKGLAVTHARSYHSIDQEIEMLRTVPLLERVAALVALAYEGGEIGDMNRLHSARESIREELPAVRMLKLGRGVGPFLASLIEAECLRTRCRRYKATLYCGYGLPATWRVRKPIPAIESIENDLSLLVSEKH